MALRLLLVGYALNRSRFGRARKHVQITLFRLDYCPYYTHFTDSRSKPKVDSDGKIRPQTHPLNHRKPDSSSQVPQFRASTKRISDRKGDRAAPGSCPPAVPLWAPRRHHDPGHIPAWAARFGSLWP